MTQFAQGSLTMVGLNTKNPVVFWNGIEIPSVTSIRVDWESDEQRIKLKIADIDPSIQAELIASGISVKKEKQQ